MSCVVFYVQIQKSQTGVHNEYLTLHYICYSYASDCKIRSYSVCDHRRYLSHFALMLANVFCVIEEERLYQAQLFLVIM